MADILIRVYCEAAPDKLAQPYARCASASQHSIAGLAENDHCRSGHPLAFLTILIRDAGWRELCRWRGQR